MKIQMTKRKKDQWFLPFTTFTEHDSKRGFGETSCNKSGKRQKDFWQFLSFYQSDLWKGLQFLTCILQLRLFCYCGASFLPTRSSSEKGRWVLEWANLSSGKKKKCIFDHELYKMSELHPVALQVFLHLPLEILLGFWQFYFKNWIAYNCELFSIHTSGKQTLFSVCSCSVCPALFFVFIYGRINGSCFVD